MTTNDDVMEAVQELTRAYNAMEQELVELRKRKDVAIPLYKNGICYYDGYDNLTTDSELYSNILGYGSVSKALYGSWNNAYMITLSQGAGFAQPKAGMPDRCFVFKTKLNNLTEDKKTFFWKSANADSYGHGYISAYICDCDSLRPKKFLGTTCAVKGSGEGRNMVFDMFNGNALQTRYHEWLAFNFDLSDAQELNGVDENDYVYIGITSTIATTYTSGWGIADRNSNFFLTPAYILTYASEPMNFKPTYSSTNNNGYCMSYIPRNGEFTGLEIPYDENIEDGLLVTFIDNTDVVYHGNMTLKGSKSGTVYRQNTVEIGNFGKLYNASQVQQNTKKISFIISKQEREENTVVKNGRKYMVFDIPKFLSDRQFYFNAVYTEDYIS